MTTEQESTGTTVGGHATPTPPPTVVLALRVALAQMIVMAVITAGTYLMEDRLRDAWASARAADLGVTVAAVAESSVVPPSFFPVALTLFVTYVMLALVLLAMVRAGARWARFSMTAVVGAYGLLQLVIGTGPGVPAVLMVLAAVSVALHGLTLVLLWHPAHRGYFRTAHNGHWAVVADGDPVAAPRD